MTKRETKRRGDDRPQVPFARKLVLNQWLFTLFGLKSSDGYVDDPRGRMPLLGAFKEKFGIDTDGVEGLDENNVHHFYYALVGRMENSETLAPEVLLAYDRNIVRHTRQLNEARLVKGEESITWKYFQYLTLLFTEVFLDHYFRDPDALVKSLNRQIEVYNATHPASDRVPPMNEEADARHQLNKLAYWMATGSGKTLVMQMNILQYRHYSEKHGNHAPLNRILLLTPNEGLSRQHLEAFDVAGMRAGLFRKDGRHYREWQEIEIIDIHKLGSEMGEKTIAVNAFEGNNLVLVDEGHRGATRGEEGAWMRFRNALCENGFSFEYSATFGQAVKGDRGMSNHYARSVLFDYSYRFFYSDGYGKDFQILNLHLPEATSGKATSENDRELYLVGCLLAFYQQQRLFREHKERLRPFHLEKPLWVFVGGGVTAGVGKKEASDILQILLFLARFIGDRQGSVARIARVLNDGVRDADGWDIFAGRFGYLDGCHLSAEQVFDAILESLFNNPAGGLLHLENLKGAQGEIALKLGSDSQPFGVVNVGNDTQLCKLCDEREELVVTERAFSGSLFRDINTSSSTVNLLIGSRKFTEGWDSWRVSTMGLMNVGSGEGSQIIQLFGRGVRLKGYGRCLKRSSKVPLPEEVEPPEQMGELETLNVFGIKADYMARFRDFLEDEGVSFLGNHAARSVKTSKPASTRPGTASMKRGMILTLRKPSPEHDQPTQHLIESPVVLNWYPEIQAIRSQDIRSGNVEKGLNEGHLTAKHVSLLDLDALYFELHRFKAERVWHNLTISKEAIWELLHDSSWYRLLIPQKELVLDSFEKVHIWQEVASALLKRYAARYDRLPR